MKIHEKMKENENKRLNQSAEKRIIGLSFNENSFILSKSVKISKKVSKKSCKTLDIFLKHDKIIVVRADKIAFKQEQNFI